jgi:truncated hemoglobin YjbI
LRAKRACIHDIGNHHSLRCDRRRSDGARACAAVLSSDGHAAGGGKLPAIHPESLEGSEAKLNDYLTGYLGGPPIYVEKYGHPRLRSRHFGAGIGPTERDEWLLCFRRALDETVENEKLRDIIWPPIERLGHHMQNKE